MKILVVDDKKESRYLLESLLKGYGHLVVTAQNGKEAMEKLQGSDYHMIISDILMPVMDGFQFCHQVKEQERFVHIPFVFYTATYVEREDEELALKIGADRFIKKPIDPEQFMDIINRLLQEMEKGQVKARESHHDNEKEVFKLYNERLVNKLEEKMLNLEQEVVRRLKAEEELKNYYSQLERLVEERTAELTRINHSLEQEIAERKKAEDALKLSEEKYKAQVKRIPIPTYTWQKKGEDFVLLNYNDAAETITQGKIPTFIGRTASEMYGHDPGILKDFMQCFTSKSTIQREMPYQFRTTGRNAFMVVNYAFVPPDFIMVHTQDITQRKQAEDALQKARNQLEVLVEERTFELTKANRQLQREIAERKQIQEELIKEKEKAQLYLDISGVMMVVVNADQTVGMINQKGCEILGYNNEDIIGKNWFENFLPPRERDRVKSTFAMLMQGLIDPVEYFENPILTSGGEERLIAWHNVIIKEEHGRIIGTLSSGQDITERKQSEKLMIQTEKMMTLAGLAAGMAHEINNPLAGILQSIQVILNRISPDIPLNQKTAREHGISTEAVQAYLEKRKIIPLMNTIKECGERAAVIVENMLNFSRSSDSKRQFHDISTLMDNTIALAESEYDLKKKYDFRQINIVREYEAGLPGVPCEGTRIQQVFFNLLRNAAQAISEVKTPSPRIIVRVKKETNFARIEVEDNGPGIPEHLRKRIFEPFFTTKTGGTGTGLGLSVAYFIITEDHQGTMEVESTPGQGTTFILRLPLQKAESKKC